MLKNAVLEETRNINLIVVYYFTKWKTFATENYS